MVLFLQKRHNTLLTSGKKTFFPPIVKFLKKLGYNDQKYQPNVTVRGEDYNRKLLFDLIFLVFWNG